MLRVSYEDLICGERCQMAGACNLHTQSISLRSSSSVAEGNATLYMVVKDIASVSYRRSTKACELLPVWVDGGSARADSTRHVQWAL